jgi:threonine synthase
VEPASAASVAGLLQRCDQGLVQPGQVVVCTVTGNGLKDVETALSGMTVTTTTVPPDPERAAAALGLAAR